MRISEENTSRTLFTANRVKELTTFRFRKVVLSLTKKKGKKKLKRERFVRHFLSVLLSRRGSLSVKRAGGGSGGGSGSISG